MTRIDARRRLMTPSLIALSLALVHCESTDGSSSEAQQAPVGESDTRSALLTSVSDQVILPTLRRFADQAADLENAAQAWKDDPSDANRTAVQTAWLAAMETWQHAEVMQVGPAGVSGDVAAGQDMRDGIYSWNIVNPCRVDQETASGDFAVSATYETKAVNVQGLDALEYLAFRTDTGNDCNALSGINKDGTWNDLSNVGALRAAHAATVASILKKRADALLAAWDENTGNFAAEFAKAGDTSMTYGSAQEALNALTDAMFYAEKTTKDMKLATPIGESGCSTDTCPDALESQYARRSKEHIRANIVAFQSLFLGAPAGTEGTGFDDLLISIGAEDLATDIAEGLVSSLAAIDAIEGDLATAINERPEQVDAAYQATRTVMTLFKTQFMATLNLEVPARAASDND